MDGNNLFPIFLKINQLNVLVIGGGAIGLEKVKALLNNDAAARITVVATIVSPELKLFLEGYPLVSVYERAFEWGDLNQKDVVISATGLNLLNEELRRVTRERNLLLNVADQPAYCDFYLSSIVQKGNLKVAISTNGKSPTLAKRLKDLLNDVLPDELEDVLLQLNVIRGQLKGSLKDKIHQLNDITRLLAEDYTNYAELQDRYKARQRN